MKILHICSSYDSSSVYKYFLEALEKEGVDNFVFVPSHPGLSADNVIYVDKKFGKLKKLLYWGEQKYLTKFIEEKVDIRKLTCIHAHRLFYGGAIALNLKKKYGIPYIVAVRNSDLYGFGRNLSILKKHGLRIMLNANKVIFISESYRTETLRRFKESNHYEELVKLSVVCTNGINDYFLRNRMTTGQHKLPCDKQVVIASFGSIDMNKNHLTTVKACERLIEEGYNVKLLLAGKVLEKSLFEKIKAKSFVEYLGLIGYDAIVRHLRGADVFVLPSFHETFGLVYAESMSQGVPIIYTHGQGFDGQFPEGEVGYSVNPANANEIVCRIKDILKEYRNISDKCVMNIERYSWNKIVRTYLTDYYIDGSSFDK